LGSSVERHKVDRPSLPDKDPRLGDQETLTHALTNTGSARLQDGDQRGRAELEQAFEVAAAAGLEDHAARALVNLATITAELQATVHRSW
jgi:2-hydroxychromene-2-carboxylate isomerase